MSKKLFSLIDGKQLRISPGVKVLKAEEYQTLLDAEELKTKALEDAERFKKEMAEEAEVLKEQSAQEGFQEGQAQWVEHIAALEKQIGEAHEEVTKLIIPVALKAAKKILGREIEANEKTVVDIILNNLKAVSHHKKIKVYVHKDDLAVVEKEKEKLKTLFEQLESLLIIESDDVKPGGSIIETEGGIINAQLENLLHTLERAFESYMTAAPVPVEDS